MKSTQLSCLLLVCSVGAWSGLAGPPETPATQPAEPEFVISNEPVALDPDYRGPLDVARYAKVVATLETRPAMSDAERSEIILRALGTVFDPRTRHVRDAVDQSGYVPGPAVLRSPEFRGFNTQGQGWISGDESFKGRGGGTPIGTRWTVLAIDEDMAKTLVLGLLDSYRSLYGQRLEQAEKSGATSEKQVAHLLDGIQKRRAERPRLEQLLQESGMASMTLDALDSAIGQLDHERRLNDIDLAGLEASLTAARQRIAALAGTGKAGEPADVQADVLRVLHRLQVEFEIQVVGKTARKEALAKELAQLKSSRDARARLLAFAEEDEKANRALPEENNSVRRSEQAIAALREALANAPVDNRVTISPLVRLRP